MTPTAEHPAAAALRNGAGAWVWDLGADRLSGDARFASLPGLDAEAMAAGMPSAAFFARVHPDDRMRLRIAVAGVAHGSELFSRDYRLFTDTGLRWVSVRGRAEHPEDGGSPEFCGVAIDITEQKRIEERLRIAQSAGGVGTFEYVEGFGTASVSDQFCRLLGLHVTDALAVRTINAVVDPDDPPLIRTPPGNIPEGPVQAELRIRRPDTGKLRWIALRGERRRDSEFSGVRFIGVIYDITETKASQAKLQELAHTLEARVEARTKERDRLWTHSRDLFAVVAADGTLTSVNPAWRRILGYREDELIGAGRVDLVHPEDAAAAADFWAKSAGALDDVDVDLRMRCKEGGWRWINWTVIPLGDAFYANGRDVTERKQLEEQLRQSQKMEAVGQLTGGIAHDFNNMLTGVLGGLDMVRRRIHTGRAEEALRFAEVATTSAERAAALTHRLLAFSRRQTLDPQLVDANRLVASMEDLLRRTLGVHVDLGVSLAPDLKMTLSDPNQLESAILNLAINARDAMPDGGKLTIETSNVRLDRVATAAMEGVEPGDYVLVSVSDSGVGMPPEVVARAFDPFFTTKPLGQGTGLGLSMVYGFVRQSGGQVGIYSEPGIGTTVKLYLPRATAEGAEQADATQLDTPEGEGEAVMVVDDDVAVRTVVAALLQELGYSVVEAPDVETALRQLDTQRRLDLLITDVGLPGLNGRQLAEVARQGRPELPVLFITGYAAGAARRSEVLGPGMEMISKPFTVEALAQKVREMVER